MKQLTLLLIVLTSLTGLVFAQAPPANPITATVPTAGTEILWDTWGIPHIYADDNVSLFYAFGWSQMRSHADLILRLYGRARGQAAEYWGDDFLQSDIMTHTLHLPQIGTAHYSAQNDQFKRYIDAFVAGMNAYAQTYPETIADEMERALPVRNTDPLTLAYSNVTLNFVASSALGSVQPWSPELLGSNGWAIAPERSASGHTLLVINPHVFWSDLFTMFEAHLIAPDVDLYGATLVGLPGMLIGFNQHLGWTHTVNMYDGFDLYELTLTEEGGGYLLDGAERKFDLEQKTIKVLGSDGTFTDHTFSIRTSVHGPVLTSPEDGHPLALRTVANSVHMMEQWWRMGTAASLEDFQTESTSRGAVLFTRWFNTYTRRAGFDIFEVPFDVLHPLDTPYGLKDPSHAVAVLRLVAQQMISEYGALDVPYGDVMRLRVGPYDLPGNGGGDPNGIFRVAWYAPDRNGMYQLVGGDSFTALVEFSQPVRARVLLAYGNATQPDSPHRGDQLPLFAAKELREPWLTRATVEANLELTEVF